MRLTVLGAGPSYTDREGASGAAYLVSTATTRVLLDLGQGSFPRIFPYLLPCDLDAVVVSHLHPDHFIDLVPLRHYLRYEFDPPRRVEVLGPRGLADRLDALWGQPGFADESLDIGPLGPAPHRIGDLTLEPLRITHAGESYAMRLSQADDAPGLVYTGDSAQEDEVEPLVRPGDVLLAEAAFGPGPVPAGAMHLDGPAVGRLASATQPARVLLTHLQMGFDPEATVASVRDAYAGPVEFVWPGITLDL